MSELDLRVSYLEDVLVKVLNKQANMSTENKKQQDPKTGTANQKPDNATGEQPPVANTVTPPVIDDAPDSVAATPQLCAKAFDVKYKSKLREVTQADVDSNSELREFLLTKHPDIFLS